MIKKYHSYGHFETSYTVLNIYYTIFPCIVTSQRALIMRQLNLIYIIKLLNKMLFSEIEKLQVSGVPNVEPPPIVSKDEQFLLLETYDSYEDYVRIMTPLFLMETWDSVCILLKSICSDWYN